MSQKITLKRLKQLHKDSFALVSAYLEKFISEVNSIDYKNLTDDSTEEKHKINELYARQSVLLDIAHRSYPLVYDLFPKDKDRLDNIYKKLKLFEKGKFLRECTCDFCKTHPVKFEKVVSPDEKKIVSPDEKKIVSSDKKKAKSINKD